MKIDSFLVEKWLNEYEHNVEVNISETCVEPFTIGEFLHLLGRENFFNEIWDTLLLNPRWREELKDLEDGG